MIYPDEIPQNDLYGRRSFARHIAKLLRDHNTKESTCIALTAPWGNGKTTTLHYLKEELELAGKVAVAEFRPYLYEDNAHLVSSFYGTLYSAVRKGDPAIADRVQNILASLSTLARFAGPASQLAFPGANYALDVLKAIIAGLHSRKDKTTPELLREAHNILADADSRFILLIDDVDRLLPHEIQSLLRLIRMVANFPNVTYVVAFDREFIIDALSKELHGNIEDAYRRRASRFLEKMFQLEIPLPSPDRAVIRKEFIQHIETLIGSLAGNDRDVVSDKDWKRLSMALNGSLLEGFRNLRTAKRFWSQAETLLPLVLGNVNVIDFMILEAIRASSPPGYDCIRDHISTLTDRTSSSEKEAQRKINVNWTEALHLPEADRLISILFPDSPSRWGESRTEYMRGLRVCVGRYSWRYFNYSLRSDEIASSDVIGLIRMAEAGEDPTPRMREFVASEHIRDQLFWELLPQCEGIAETGCRNIGMAISRNFDVLPFKSDKFASFHSPGRQAVDTWLVCASKVHVAHRVTWMRNVLRGISNVKAYAWILVQLRPEGGPEDLLSMGDWEVIVREFVRVIEEEDMKKPLYRWEPRGDSKLAYELIAEYGNRSALRRRLSRRFREEPQDVLRFLLEFVGVMATGHPGDLTRNNYETISKIVSPRTVSTAIRKVSRLPKFGDKWPMIHDLPGQFDREKIGVSEDDGSLQAAQFICHEQQGRKGGKGSAKARDE